MKLIAMMTLLVILTSCASESLTPAQKDAARREARRDARSKF